MVAELTFASVGGDCAQYAYSDAWHIFMVEENEEFYP